MSIYIYRDWADPIRSHFHMDPRFEMDFSPDFDVLPLTLANMRRNAKRHNKEGHAVPKAVNAGDFSVNVDVQQFKPEEITVKVVDNSIVVEGKHEERQDEHGFVSRQFARRYVLPEEYDIQKVASSLSSDGVLTLTAPKCEALESKERIIPVVHTGPHKTQDKKDVAANPPPTPTPSPADEQPDNA